MIDTNSTKAEVLEAVKQWGWNLEHASYALRSDREVVLAAVSRNGLALQFASDELRGDRDVVMAAVKESGRALSYSSRKYKNTKLVNARIKWKGKVTVTGDTTFQKVRIVTGKQHQ